MQQVVVVGGGGHAKVIIELLEESGNFDIVACTASRSDTPAVLDVPIVGDDSQLPGMFAAGVRNAFVAIGNNRLRRSLTHHVVSLGFNLINAVSRRAVISRRAEVGNGVAIMAGAVINSCTRIGTGGIVNTGATVDHDCNIGDWVHIAPGANLAGCVSIGEGAFLGIGSRIIPGISIGEWSTVGAGAVVIRSLPSAVTAVGVPARITTRPKI